MKNIQLSSLGLMCLLFVLLSSSCISTKHYADRINDPDYNYRVEVKNPQFRKKLNAVGLTTTIGMTAVGAYAGYQSNLIGIQKEGQRKSVSAGNAVIGGLLGLGISSLINIAMGHTKSYAANSKKSEAKWLKKFGKEYQILHKNYNRLTLIPNTVEVERKFVLKNFEDLEDFKITFPNSNLFDRKVSNGIRNFSRNDGIKTYEKYYQNLSTNTQSELKVSLLSLSNSLNEKMELYKLAENNSDSGFEIAILDSANKRIKELSFYRLKEELRNFKYVYSDSDWIESIVSSLENKGPDKLSEIGDLFETHACVLNNDKDYYTYIPPGEFGVYSFNQVDQRYYDVKAFVGNTPVDFSFLQVIPSKIDLAGLVTIYTNATSLNFITNSSRNNGILLKLSFHKLDKRRTGQFCFHTLNNSTMLKIGIDSAVDEVSSEAKKWLKSKLGMKTEGKSFLEHAYNLLVLDSGSDAEVRKVLLSYLCYSCSSVEINTLNEILRHAHVK